MVRGFKLLCRRPVRASALVVWLGVVCACGGGGGGGTPPPAPVGSPPAAQVHVPLAGPFATGQALRVYGQGTDPDGHALTYAWDFENDGTDDATTQSAEFTPPAAGTYVLMLRVTDQTGRSARASATVIVQDVAADPSPPDVSVRAWTLSGSAPFEVHFEATASDPQGAVAHRFTWDADSDGTPEQDGALSRATLLYQTAGSYQVTVTVTDEGDQTSSATVALSLCDGGLPDVGPAAMIHVTDGSLLTQTNTPIELIAVGSDPDGGALASIDWDLDDDGAFDDAAGRVIQASYATEGEHRVRVRLGDDDGRAPSEAEVTLVVRDGPGAPTIPTAWASAEALLVAPDTTVQLHARAEDFDGEAFTFSWDFDGDGAEDSTDADPRFAFPLPGIYMPRLTVTDVGGRVAYSLMTIVVDACTENVAPPYFWYEGNDVLVLHGGLGDFGIDLVGVQGGLPSQYQVIYKAGPAGTHALGAGLVVDDGTGATVPPATPPQPVPVGTPLPVSAESIEVDGPARLELFTVGVRIAEPGTRVQVLVCQVSVLHEVVSATLIQGPVGNQQAGVLDLRKLNQTLPNLQVPIPDVYGIEILFADTTPALTEITGPFFLPAGWSALAIAGGYRFSGATPVVDEVAPQPTRLNFFFNPAITGGVIRLLDQAGNVIGKQALTLP